MRFVVSIVLFLTVCGTTSAQRDHGAMMMGAGMNSCAEFAQHYRQDPKSMELLYFSWAQGYMSGLNVLQAALKRPMRDLNKMPISDQMFMIRTACNERPLSTVGQVVQDFFNTLPPIPPQSN